MKLVLSHLVLAALALTWSGTLEAEETAESKAAAIRAARRAAKEAEEGYRMKPGDKAARAAVIATKRALWLAEKAAFVPPPEEKPKPLTLTLPPMLKLLNVLPAAVKVEEAKPAEKPAAAKVETEVAAPKIAVPAGAKIEVKAEEKPAEKPAAKPAADPPRVIVVPARPAVARPVAPQAVAIEAAAAAQAAQIDAQVLQYEQMMIPRMWRELEFIRESCELAPDQRPKIKAAALASVKQAAKDFVGNRQKAGRGDFFTYIRKEIVSSLETLLTPEQLAEYRVDAARRTEATKRSTIRSTVALLDGFLYLSREQRDKISETLLDNWNDSWEQWLYVSRYGGRYFPTIPDTHLTPHLNEKQKKVWQGAQKINPGFWGGEQRADIDDDWWSGKDQPEQPQAGTNGAEAKPAAEEDQ